MNFNVIFFFFLLFDKQQFVIPGVHRTPYIDHVPPTYQMAIKIKGGYDEFFKDQDPNAWDDYNKLREDAITRAKDVRSYGRRG